jgi:hypothetical protein
VTHRATEEFWRLYDALPEQVRSQADKAFRLLRQDPKHPSLHFENVGRYWSARIGRQFRAVSVVRDDLCVWFWIGDHEDYERLLRKR